MESIFRTTSYPIKTLIDNIGYGIVALPDIQRPFVWDSTQVRDLFDSIYRGFPTGYLLFWDNALDPNAKIIGDNEKKSSPKSLIIDGQQRLTALFTTIKAIPVLNANFVRKRIVIAFNPLTETFEVSNPAIDKNAEYVSDISVLFKDDFKERAFINSFINNIRKVRELHDEEEEKIDLNISAVRTIINYSFTILEVSADIDEETVANIFVRVNSKGVVLKQSDFVLTLLSVFWDEGRKAIEQFCYNSRYKFDENKPSPFNPIVKADSEGILKSIIGFGFKRGRMKDVYSLLRGRDFETREFNKDLQIKRIDEFKDYLSKTLKIDTWLYFINLIQSLGFQSQSLITSKTNFFYSYAFYLIGKYNFDIKFKELDKIISKLFLFGAITSRYSGSSETIYDGDLRVIINAKDGQDFIDILSKIIHNEVTDDFWNITAPSLLESSSARNPLSLIFTAAQIKNNVNLLFSDNKIANLFNPLLIPNKSLLDKHHIFPKGYLNRIDIKDLISQNQVANFVYLGFKENIDISSKAPKDYFPEYIKEPSNEIHEEFKNHAIPPNILDLTYDEFLKERRKLMAKYIKEYFEKI